MNDLKIPVGISDFTKIRENGYYYIDKTELRDEYACQLSGYSERQRKSV